MTTKQDLRVQRWWTFERQVLGVGEDISDVLLLLFALHSVCGFLMNIWLVITGGKNARLGEI